jgi:hypothetical protein
MIRGGERGTLVIECGYMCEMLMVYGRCMLLDICLWKDPWDHVTFLLATRNCGNGGTVIEPLHPPT